MQYFVSESWKYAICGCLTDSHIQILAAKIGQFASSSSQQDPDQTFHSGTQWSRSATVLVRTQPMANGWQPWCQWCAPPPPPCCKCQGLSASWFSTYLHRLHSETHSSQQRHDCIDFQPQVIRNKMEKLKSLKMKPDSELGIGR